MTQITIPEGYRMNAQGYLVHESLIKPIDQARDKLVLELVEKAKVISKLLAEFKGSAFGDVAAFVDMSVEEYGVKRRGTKGNISLQSFDGRYMIKKAVQETIQFDERFIAAKELIDQCLVEWTEGARPEIVALVNDAFRTDTNGQIRVARVLALRRLNITDERWQKAMQIIGEACQVAGSKDYIRLYQRVGDTDQWEAIPLDIAGARV